MGWSPTRPPSARGAAASVSRRWQPAALENPELNPTSNRVAVLFWVFLATLTFVLIVVGYGTGFWG